MASSSPLWDCWWDWWGAGIPRSPEGGQPVNLCIPKPCYAIWGRKGCFWELSPLAPWPIWGACPAVAGQPIHALWASARLRLGPLSL